MSALVFIHIPKAAGTSHRQYLEQVYGEKSMFWYGLDSDSEVFDKKEVRKAHVIGGHRPLEFFPPAYKAIYTSIIRDPVERAVSFFNYRASPPNDKEDEQWVKNRESALQYWLDRGIDPSSMRKSIENCEEFRTDVSNLQCQYLSWHGATFAGVLKSFQQTNMVVGVFDQLQKFNEFFQKELSYPIENRRRANVASSGYSTDILREPGLVDLIRSLNVEDQLLYDYVRYENAGLYAGADDLPTIRKYVPNPKAYVKKVVEPEPIQWKHVQVYSKGILKVVPGTPTLISLMIKNGTNQQVEFSTVEGEDCAIAWQFQDETGQKIAGLEGVAYGELILLPRQTKQINVWFQLEPDQVLGVQPRSVEFSIVEKHKRIRDDYPLNCSWAIVHLEHLAN